VLGGGSFVNPTLMVVLSVVGGSLESVTFHSPLKFINTKQKMKNANRLVLVPKSYRLHAFNNWFYNTVFPIVIPLYQFLLFLFLLKAGKHFGILTHVPCAF